MSDCLYCRPYLGLHEEKCLMRERSFVRPGDRLPLAGETPPDAAPAPGTCRGWECGCEHDQKHTACPTHAKSDVYLIPAPLPALDEAFTILDLAVLNRNTENYEKAKESIRLALAAKDAQIQEAKYDTANQIREMWLTSTNFSRDINELCIRLGERAK